MFCYLWKFIVYSSLFLWLDWISWASRLSSPLSTPFLIRMRIHCFVGIIPLHLVHIVVQCTTSYSLTTLNHAYASSIYPFHRSTARDNPLTDCTYVNFVTTSILFVCKIMLAHHFLHTICPVLFSNSLSCSFHSSIFLFIFVRTIDLRSCILPSFLSPFIPAPYFHLLSDNNVYRINSLYQIYLQLIVAKQVKLLSSLKR